MGVCPSLNLGSPIQAPWVLTSAPRAPGANLKMGLPKSQASGSPTPQRGALCLRPPSSLPTVPAYQVLPHSPTPACGGPLSASSQAPHLLAFPTPLIPASAFQTQRWCRQSAPGGGGGQLQAASCPTPNARTRVRVHALAPVCIRTRAQRFIHAVMRVHTAASQPRPCGGKARAAGCRAGVPASHSPLPLPARSWLVVQVPTLQGTAAQPATLWGHPSHMALFHSDHGPGWPCARHREPTAGPAPGPALPGGRPLPTTGRSSHCRHTEAQAFAGSQPRAAACTGLSQSRPSVGHEQREARPLYICLLLVGDVGLTPASISPEDGVTAGVPEAKGPFSCRPPPPRSQPKPPDTTSLLGHGRWTWWAPACGLSAAAPLLSVSKAVLGRQCG